MPETEYRASRICRILGNPTAYQIIKSLFKGGKSPTKVSEGIGVSIAAISKTLSHLRNIDLVRYEVKSNERIYWLEHRDVIEIMANK